MRKEGKSSSLIKRHVVGALILPFFFAYIYYLSPIPYFLALLGLAAVIAMWEFYVMYKVPVKLYIPGIMIGSALFYLSCRYPEYFISGVFISMFLLLFLRLFLKATPAGCMSDIGPIGTGFFYIAFFLSFQWLIRTGDYGLENIFLLYISVWFADGMAYYIGTYMGRYKLYPAVSPNKTVEGAVGSLIGGALGAVIIKTVFHLPHISTNGAIAIGAILGIAALTGDLIESMFKRDAGVKDSSNLIPGHGGILDKLDGFLVAGPVLYFIVRYY
jgi:phosphatidate cytidylyltransferase